MYLANMGKYEYMSVLSIISYIHKVWVINIYIFKKNYDYLFISLGRKMQDLMNVKNLI